MSIHFFLTCPSQLFALLRSNPTTAQSFSKVLLCVFQFPYFCSFCGGLRHPVTCEIRSEGTKNQGAINSFRKKNKFTGHYQIWGSLVLIGWGGVRRGWSSTVWATGHHGGRPRAPSLRKHVMFMNECSASKQLEGLLTEAECVRTLPFVHLVILGCHHDNDLENWSDARDYCVGFWAIARHIYVFSRGRC